MFDYAAWLRRAAQFIEERRKLPGDVRVERGISPPISQSQIEDLARHVRLPIPAPLRRFWAEAGGGCKCTYWWDSPPEFEHQLRIAFPHWQASHIWGGIEMDEPAAVVELLESCTDWADGFRLEHPKDARFWEHSIPLFPVRNGDYVGLYVHDAPDNPAVAYLCHEGGGSSHIIAPSFDDFLAKWEELGYIGIHFLYGFMNRRTELLEPAHFPIELAATKALLDGLVLSDIAPPEPVFTEQGWLELKQPHLMIDWLESTGRTEDRSFRLFCCACCRRVWEHLGDSGRKGVEVAERYADQQATDAELSGAREALAGPGPTMESEASTEDIPDFETFVNAQLGDPLNAGPQFQLSGLLASIRFARSEGIMHLAAYSAIDASTMITWNINQHLDEPALSLEKAAQCDLLRHIFGNPFQPPNHVPPISSLTRALANQLYIGSDSRQELLAALESEGHAELAEHFREPNHPKGCWALDLIMNVMR